MSQRLKAFLGVAAVGMLASASGFVVRSRQSDATTGTMVLCADRKGSVVVRSACRRDERLMPVAPSSARSIELPALTVPPGSAESASPNKTSLRRVPFVLNAMVETVSLLAETPRVYTRRIRFATGSPIASSVTSSVSSEDPNDRWNQTAILPNCPLETPVIVGRGFSLGPSPIAGLQPVELEIGHVWQLVDEFGSDVISLELDDDLLNSTLTTADNVVDGIETLWFDLDVFASVTCIPITGLTTSP